jgi:thiamine biosynthesis lipoprotein
LIFSLPVSNRAVCTSGDYERLGPINAQEHHILDPRTKVSVRGVASVTVVAPTAILADAVATAAFVLGPEDGIRLFERLGVDGLIITPALERYLTQGMRDGD